MTEARTEQSTVGRLTRLVDRLESVAGFVEVVASLRAGHGATFDGVWGSSCALAAAALLRHAEGPLIVVCPHPNEIDEVVDDLALFSETLAQCFPAIENTGADRLVLDDLYGQRLRLLKQLAKREPVRLIVTSIQALLQPVPAASLLNAHSRTLQRGDQADLDELTRWLVQKGFQHLSAVELPGEFSVRGGIVDVFPPDLDHPVRIEFFGDEIESIRAFDATAQRSLAVIDAIDLSMLDPGMLGDASLMDYVPTNSWFLLLEPLELDEEGRHFLRRVDEPEKHHNVAETLRRIYQFPSVTAEGVAGGLFETACHLQVESVERFSGEITRIRDELQAAAGAGQEVYIVCQTEAEVQRLSEVFHETRLAQEGRLNYAVGHLQAGFRLVPTQAMVLSSAELFRRVDTARTSRRRLGRVIDSFLELREGDYVVHVGHGIGRYRGLKLLEKEQQSEEHLEIEFHGGTKIFVPATNIELVQKYVGGTKSRPTLARIGGRSWSRQKEKAAEAVNDLAQEMLELHAMRASRPGIAFPADTEWQSEFDAAFPYRETPDQLAAIGDVKVDMQASRPMDRLICGEVGYGKTEVAMRAAFKAVDSGYQVAVLVPTTVLAEQHRRTFTGRMAEYPFQIASLSRFLTRKQQDEVLLGIESGEIDIVIGTHRLVQPDVRFHNLGLVVIDEEQRFGVGAKERLKTLRQIVDVLTLTATPIPRTLHMSLLGLRDISNLETPPEDRLAVETRVTRFNRDLIRQAVLRELNREGQVFFVHNRIHDIEAVASQLRQCVPEARLVVGHGQMAEGELEEVMADFVNHRYDILLATTIIESGLDIPNANTIFINEADRYGLADLHQLRGRVGRYKHRAYCYLLLDQHKLLNPSAVKRMRAIEEFSDMGAGFAIAMRDLEIRGAGNILGNEQSGHIAAVGYELYCDLLERAVRRLKNMPPKLTVDVNIDLPGEAYLPRNYVPDMRLKIDLYRRLARVPSSIELADFRVELIDRFGALSAPVERLLQLMELRLLAHAWRIHTIRLEDQFVAFDYASSRRIEDLARAAGKQLRVADGKTAYLPMEKEVVSPEEIFAKIKSLLQLRAVAR